MADFEDDWGGSSTTANQSHSDAPKTSAPVEDDWGNGSTTTNQNNNNAPDKNVPVEDEWGNGGTTTNQNNSHVPKTSAPVDDPWGDTSGTNNSHGNDTRQKPAPSNDSWGGGGNAGNNYGNDSRRRSAQPGGGWGDGNRSNNNFRNDNRRRPGPSNDSWGGGGGGGGERRPAPSNDSWGGGGERRSAPSNDSWGGRGERRSAPSNDSWGGRGERRSAPSNDSWGGGGESSANSAGETTARADDSWGGGGSNNNNRNEGRRKFTPRNNESNNSHGNTNHSQNDASWTTPAATNSWGDDDTKNDATNSNNNNGDGAERPAPYKPEQMNLDEEAELQATDAGENFQRYKDHKVTCVPMDLVKPIEKFEDVIQSKLLLGNLKTLKYSEMTPIQKWAMPAIIDGHDIIGCAQTGSGKTAAFLLPVLQAILKTELEPHDPNEDCRHPFCLIVSPTRELAKQIYTHAQLLSKDSIIKCRVIYGQISTHYLKAQMSDGCHVLVATLGRLKDFLERGWIDFANIKYVILDEGDRLVDERSTSDIRFIFQHPTMPPKEKRQTLFFSATFKEGIQHNAKEYLNDNFIFLAVGRVGAANEDIKQEFLQVARKDKKRELRQILQQVPPEEKTIVFTQTKHIADILAGFFTSLNLESTSIHGDRHQSQREEAISLFRRGKKRFLISSPVGNRGLDLPKVGLVINYDLPENIDEYVHRIGRTGRAGHTGRAISFYDAERDREILPDLLRILKDAKQEIPDWLTDESSNTFSADYSMGEKRPADDDAGNTPKKLDSGEQAVEPSGAGAQPFEEEW